MTEDVLTADVAGLLGCQRCARVWPSNTKRCARCGARLSPRNRKGMFWVWFWWVAGLAAYIPANLWPMLETRVLLTRSDDTIVAGAWKLATHGSILIAVVILLASVVIPLCKFAAIAILARSVTGNGGLTPNWNHRLFEAVEYIGRWSMIDVFVVAILSSLVQFSVIATVKPGPAALAFALSVI
ncbi:paraquat-inducible protein A, partial [Rhodobacteraceae bacterium]|nr:paraquat-inducible protein A [Paracoccaceae bacterium]